LVRTAIFIQAIRARGRRDGFSGNKASEADESDEDHSKRFREHVAVIVQGVDARVVRLMDLWLIAWISSSFYTALHRGVGLAYLCV